MEVLVIGWRKLKNQHEIRLEQRIAAVGARVEAYVKKNFGIRFWNPRPEDKVRMLRLSQWEEKYMVKVEWQLGKLIPVWREKYSKYQQNGIGVTIPTLCGKKSEEILVQLIKEQYPDGEHILIWKNLKRDVLWEATQERTPSRSARLTPQQFLRSYRKRMEEERHGRRKFERLMRRRNYRNNPFL